MNDRSDEYKELLRLAGERANLGADIRLAQNSEEHSAKNYNEAKLDYDRAKKLTNDRRALLDAWLKKRETETLTIS